MRKTDLSLKKLLNTNTYATLKDLAILDSDLLNGTMSGSLIKESHFENTTLTNFEFQATELKQVTFVNCKFVDCKFNFSSLLECNFISATFENCEIIAGKCRACNFFSCCFIDGNLNYELWKDNQLFDCHFNNLDFENSFHELNLVKESYLLSFQNPSYEHAA